MIYTVTFNPALDYVMYVDNLNTGTVNRCAVEKFFPGGKGINVSIVLNRLGVDSIALGFVAGFVGKEIENGVKNMGVKTDFIHLKDGMSRINVKIKSNNETDINGKGPDITTDAVDKLFSKLNEIDSGDTLVISGSIPDSLPDDIYETIIKMLRVKNIKIVVDATKDLLLNVLPYRPFLIKPNNFELGEMFGKNLDTVDDVILHAKKLQDMGAKNVLVSMAAEGAVLLTETGDIFKIGVAKGKVVNSVGAGDSMVAGFLAGYEKTGDFEYALKMGTAAGGATAFSEGLAEGEDVLNIMKTL